MPLYLLFPLFSSIVFVVGMLFAKKAILRGASPWTSTFLANFWLAIGWAAIGCIQGNVLPVSGWWQAGLVGLAFVAGQMLNYLAFQYGDVSVATPVFGVKVIIVAVILSLLAGQKIGERIWIGAILAAIGVGVIQAGARPAAGSGLTRGRAALSVLLALLSATALSIFDTGLQIWGRQWGGEKFLPATFVAAGLLSCGFLPWVDRPSRLKQLDATSPMIVSTLLIAIQAMSMSYSLANYGDATRINIVYALRGLWAVGLAWLLAHAMDGPEARHPRWILFLRLLGAVLLTISVVVALSQN